MDIGYDDVIGEQKMPNVAGRLYVDFHFNTLLGQPREAISAMIDAASADPSLVTPWRPTG